MRRWRRASTAATTSTAVWPRARRPSTLVMRAPGRAASADAPAGAVRRGRLRPRRAVPAIGHRPAGARRRRCAAGRTTRRAGALLRAAVGRRAAGRPRRALAGRMHAGGARPTSPCSPRCSKRGRWSRRAPRRAQLARHRSRRRCWPPRDYFIAKREEQRARHARFDDTSDNLEPNLKEGPGGLRDMQTLRWMALRVLGARGLRAAGRAGPAGRRRIRHARARTPRAVAPALRPAPGRRASARSACVSTTRRRWRRAWASPTSEGNARRRADDAGLLPQRRRWCCAINERLLQRFEEQLEGEAVPEPLGDGFESRRGYLHATRSAMAARHRRRLRAVRRRGQRIRDCAACIR